MEDDLPAAQQRVEVTAQAYARAEGACLVFLRQAQAADVRSLSSAEVITLIRRYGRATQLYHEAMVDMISKSFLSNGATEELAVMHRQLRELEIKSNRILSRLDNLCIRYSHAVMNVYSA